MSITVTVTRLPKRGGFDVRIGGRVVANVLRGRDVLAIARDHGATRIVFE